MDKFEAGIPGQDWDAKVAALGGGILQSRGWALFQQALGRKTWFAGGGDWLCLAVERRGRGIKYLYSPYGPVSKSSGQAAMRALAELGSSLKADFVRVEPTAAEPARSDLVRVGDVQPSRTVILDLSKSEEELKNGISQSNRNLINQAAGRGLTISSQAQPTAQDVEAFIAMLKRTAKQAGFQIYDDEYYRQTFQILSPLGMCSLYSAGAEGQTVAMAVAFDFAGTRYYAHAAADAELNRQHKAAVPLLWQMVADAKSGGQKRFDFWGIAPNDDPGHPMAGLTRFKLSFGGDIKTYAGTWDRPLKPAKYQLYRFAKKVLA